MLMVKRLERNCTACPSQWEGEGANGESLYIRFRWGCLRVEVNDRTVYEEEISDGLDGYLTNEELVERTKAVLEFPRAWG